MILWLLKGVAVLWLLQVTLFVVGISLFSNTSPSRERRLGQREEEPAASNVDSKRAA